MLPQKDGEHVAMESQPGEMVKKRISQGGLVWQTWGQFATYLDEYYYVQGFKKIWLPRKILLVNVHFIDQNHDRPSFSVFLLEPCIMLWISS